MDGLISRRQLIALLETEKEYRSNRGEIGAGKGLCYALEIVDDMPSATMYGYNIDNLLFIASILKEKNIPPENVADMVKDVGRVIEYAIDSFNAHIEKTLKEQMALPEPPKEE